MRHREADVGIIAAVVVLASVALAVGAPTAVTAVLGIALLVAPGYLLGELVLGSHVSGLERLAVVTGLAFCVPILGGTLMYFAGLPLRRDTWLPLLAGVTVVAEVVLILRRLLRRRGGLPQPLIRSTGRGRVPAGHAAAFGAALVIAVGAVGLARIGVARQHYPGFTQLWLTHRNQNAPTVDLGVGNNEGRTMRYRLVLLHNGNRAASWNLTLVNGQTWHQSSRFGHFTIVADLFRLPDLVHVYRDVAIYGDGTPGG